MNTKTTLLLGVSLLAGTWGMGTQAIAAPRGIYNPVLIMTNITAPQDKARVSSPLVVRGTAAKNRQIEVNVKATFSGGEQDLGTFKATADSNGNWSTTPINLWLPEGAKNAEFIIAASQIINNKSGLTKTITVTPPLKIDFRRVEPRYIDPKLLTLYPSITSPTENARVTSPLTVRGNGQRDGQVEVNVKAVYTGGEQDLGTFKVKSNNKGDWNTTPINLWLPEGAKNAHYEVVASQKVGSRTYSSKMLKVLPPLNVIFRPAYPINPGTLQLGPVIKSPADNARVTSPLTVKGTARKDAEVELSVKAVYSGGENDLGTFKVNANNKGEWNSTPVNLWLPEGAKNAHFEIVASQKVGSRSYSSKTVKVRPPLNIKRLPYRPGAVNPTTITPPVFTSPAENSRVNLPFDLRGVGTPGRQVEVTIKAEWRETILHTMVRTVHKDFGPYTANVSAGARWNISNLKLDVPNGAYNIKYTITAVQLFPGNKRSAEATLKLDGHR